MKRCDNSYLMLIVGAAWFLFPSPAFAQSDQTSEKPAAAELSKSRYTFDQLVHLNSLRKEDYPEEYKQWGESGFKRFNAMVAPALRKAMPLCDDTEADPRAMFDFDKEPNKAPPIVVDCEGKNDKGHSRFFFTEDDLKSNAPAISAKDRLAKVSNSEAITACEEALKESLIHRSTFESGWFGTSVYRAEDVGNMVVTIDFEARNSFNLALKYRGTCGFDYRGVMQRPEIQER